MGSSTSQIALYVLLACFLGIVIGWAVQTVIGQRRIGKLARETKAKVADVNAQRDEFARQLTRSHSTIESLQAAIAKRNTELKSALEKSKLLAKNVLTLRTDRENTKVKVSVIQNALLALKQRTAALQAEFDNSREFYKRELIKSFDKRKLLEEDVKKVRAEQEAFEKSVQSSVLEHGSAENMVAAAQLRFGQIDVLERNVNKLEAENAQLRQDAIEAKRQVDARERELAELEELRIHNKELVRCVEALEGSRKEHETDAERYRQAADESEKLSETLRLKLDDLERNFADIEIKQNKALKDARKATVVPILRKQS